MWRVFIGLVFLMITAVPGDAWHRQESLLAEIGLSATPSNIAGVVSGKSCEAPNGDVLKFGALVSGQSGEFVHSGHTVATYHVGYASVYVTRNGELHSHVVTVSPQKHQLHFNAANYQC